MAAAAVTADLTTAYAAPAAGTAKDPLTGPVRIDTGLVSGTQALLSGVAVYKGIPYAASTAGANRWRPSQPPAAWSGVRKADAFGDICPQGGAMGPGAAPSPSSSPSPTSSPSPSPSSSASQTAMSEDCLNLNVWTAAASAKERRPVLVWIYGGRFVSGSGSDPAFDGSGLAAKGLVVVTLNYRTGVFGFLATPELSAESGHGSGNYGLLDQIAALRWVRRNIHAFGGDPNRVTIAGQSAGAASVQHLVYSPLTRGLFHGAIMESGAYHPRDTQIRTLASSYRTLATAESQGTAYATAHNAATLADLRALTVTELLVGNNANDTSVPGNPPPPLFRPVLDGYVMPRTYWEALRTGAQHDVPIMNGNNRNENGASPNLSVTVSGYQSTAASTYGSMADEFLTLYPASTDSEASARTGDAIRDRDRTSAHLWATAWARTAKSPVFSYFWTHAPPGQSSGAYHGSEIQYMFGNLYAGGSSWTDTDEEIADRLSSYVVNFVTHGDPNGSGLPVWAASKADTPTVMELGDAWKPVKVAAPAKADFFERFFNTQQPW